MKIFFFISLLRSSHKIRNSPSIDFDKGLRKAALALQFVDTLKLWITSNEHLKEGVLGLSNSRYNYFLKINVNKKFISLIHGKAPSQEIICMKKLFRHNKRNHSFREPSDIFYTLTYEKNFYKLFLLTEGLLVLVYNRNSPLCKDADDFGWSQFLLFFYRNELFAFLTKHVFVNAQELAAFLKTNFPNLPLSDKNQSSLNAFDKNNFVFFTSGNTAGSLVPQPRLYQVFNICCFGQNCPKSEKRCIENKEPTVQIEELDCEQETSPEEIIESDFLDLPSPLEENKLEENVNLQTPKTQNTNDPKRLFYVIAIVSGFLLVLVFVLVFIGIKIKCLFFCNDEVRIL